MNGCTAHPQSTQDLRVDNEHKVSPLQVLRLSKDSGCSAYDCECVASAHHLNVRSVTADKQLLKTFPNAAMANNHPRCPSNPAMAVPTTVPSRVATKNNPSLAHHFCSMVKAGSLCAAV